MAFLRFFCDNDLAGGGVCTCLETYQQQRSKLCLTGKPWVWRNRLAVHKPPRLKPGARIGVVAPAGCVEPDAIRRGVAAIEAEGFEVELGASLYARKGYLAGSPIERAGDLMNFFGRADIGAIFCARGGFGSIQLLPHLRSVLLNQPKIFAGYSDITILLNWLNQACSMMTFHAPMVAEDIARGLTDQAKAYFWQVLSGDLESWSVCLHASVRPGVAEAQMVGGCLSMLVTTLGTPYQIDARGKLLFMEDVGERPYRLERMLTHLKLAGTLDQVAGVVFGHFTGCDGDGQRDIEQIVAELFQDAPYPVVMGMKAGHGQENFALPFGARMRLDGNNATLALLESPVS